MNTRSISLKIDITLVVLFLTMLIISALYQFTSQRAMVEEMVIVQANGLAESYFDNVNTLMLTGKMAQKEIARSKVTARAEVLDAKVLRGARCGAFGLETHSWAIQRLHRTSQTEHVPITAHCRDRPAR